MTDNEIKGALIIFAGIFIILFVVERIRWVRSARLQLVESDFAELVALPSGWFMFWRFWVWNVDRFLR